MAILQATNLTVLRGENALFQNMNFSVSSGDSLVVTGCNGSGKTSLLKSLLGLLPVESGVVSWNNVPIKSNLAGFYSSMAFLGHGNGLRLCLTVKENILRRLNLLGCAVNEKKLEQLAKQFSIFKILDTSAKKISAGQARKAALIAMFCCKQQLLIFDEPFVNLDVTATDLVNLIFAEHLNNGGMIVSTCHDKLPDRIINRVINLDRG